MAPTEILSQRTHRVSLLFNWTMHFWTSFNNWNNFKNLNYIFSLQCLPFFICFFKSFSWSWECVSFSGRQCLSPDGEPSECCRSPQCCCSSFGRGPSYFVPPTPSDSNHNGQSSPDDQWFWSPSTHRSRRHPRLAVRPIRSGRGQWLRKLLGIGLAPLGGSNGILDRSLWWVICTIKTPLVN